MQQLEAQLGVRLLHCTTRRVELTQDGRTFFERSQDLLADVDELQSILRHDGTALRGRVRIDMSTGIAPSAVIPQLPHLLAQHLALEFELSSTERFVDLVREGFNCVLRGGTVESPGLIARPVGPMRMVNGASPAYLKSHGTPMPLTLLYANCRQLSRRVRVVMAGWPM